MALSPLQALALEAHRELERRLAAGGHGRFFSGYDTTHPFVETYLGEALKNGLHQKLGSYNYPQDYSRLTEAIRTFHRAADGVDYSPQEVFVSAGSSPLILTILMWLSGQGHSHALYFRPLYHTFYFLADRLGMSLEAVGDAPFWDADAVPALPDRQTALLMSDPIWFAGREVGAAALDAVCRWQERTGSAVVIDGTFQYLKWSGGLRDERASRFDRARTLRIICPTKSLAVHGVRFAYVLGPPDVITELSWTAQNITGASGALDLHAGIRILEVLAGPRGNRELIEYVTTSHQRLLDNGVLLDTVREPHCGYYVFGRLAQPRADDLVMTAEHFDLAGHRGLVRVNLLSPDAC